VRGRSARRGARDGGENEDGRGGRLSAPAALAVPLALGQRVAGVIFSRGPGYEPQPPGLLFEPDRVAGYFVDFRSKTYAKAAREPASLLPVDLAQLALGWYERMLFGEAQATRHFENACRLLLAQAEESGDALLWPHVLTIPKYGLSGRWYAGMAQGQAASVFVRAYLHGRQPEYEAAALRALEPLLRRDSRFVTTTPSGPILEEAEASRPSHILNGWIFSMWGLWDVRVGLDESSVGSLLDETIACLRARLAEYDVGWWTRYSLFPHPLPDLAKPFYHRLHVDQMAVLHRLTGISEFGSASRRWAAYDSVYARSLAVAHKIPFKLTDALTRGRA
jgi:heparosan-N-sulfate-glucuronate 5-epimerase